MLNSSLVGIPSLTFEQFAKKYCDRQINKPEELKKIFLRQKELYNPDGWMMLEVAYIGARNSGDLTILPYGGTATYKEVPTHPVSPRGLASDMSVVVAALLVENL